MNASDPPFASGQPPARSLHILYAEDMRELREVARFSLERAGHRIECVADGEVALTRILATPDDYDLLITDHSMPVMDGLELVTQARDHHFPGKIVVFSSELSTAVAEAYRSAHVDRILHKPVFPSQLREVLTELFPPAGSPP